MDGRECLADILRIDSKAKVLIASGYSETGHSKRMLALGAKGFVEKPYNTRPLLTTMPDIIDQKSDST